MQNRKYLVILFVLSGVMISGLVYSAGLPRQLVEEVRPIDLDESAKRKEAERKARIAKIREIVCSTGVAMIRFGDSEGSIHQKPIFTSDGFPGMDSPVWCKDSGFVHDAATITNADAMHIALAQYDL